MAEKVLNDIASEAGVIATVIKHPDFALEADYLTPSDFSDEINKSVYWALIELSKRGVSNIDALALSTTLNSTKAKEERIQDVDVDTLNEIVEYSDDMARHVFKDFESLVTNIKEYSAIRDLHRNCVELANMCMSEHTNAKILQEFLFNMVEQNSLAGSSRAILDMGSKIDSILDEIRELQKAEVVKLPLPTLADFIKLFQGQLAVFCGKTKSGKSAMLLTCALDALKQGKHVLYVDSELDDTEFTMRLIAQAANVPYGKIETGKFDDKEEKRIEEALKDPMILPNLHHEYLPAFTGTEILNIFKKVNARNKVDLFIIDYFKDSGEGTAFDGSQRLGNLVNLVKNDIAGAYKIPALGAAQLNPNGEIAASNRLAMFASSVIKILPKTQTEIFEDGGDEFGRMKLVVTHNRRGAKHDSENEYISVCYDGPTLRFYEPPHQPVREEEF